MTRYLLPGAAALTLALVGLVWWQHAWIDALRDETARLERAVKAEREAAAQARLAREVAEAHAERQRARAEEYDALREALLRGDADAPLPDWFRAYLDRLLAGDAVADP